MKESKSAGLRTNITQLANLPSKARYDCLDAIRLNYGLDHVPFHQDIK